MKHTFFAPDRIGRKSKILLCLTDTRFYVNTYLCHREIKKKYFKENVNCKKNYAKIRASKAISMLNAFVLVVFLFVLPFCEMKWLTDQF